MSEIVHPLEKKGWNILSTFFLEKRFRSGILRKISAAADSPCLLELIVL